MKPCADTGYEPIHYHPGGMQMPGRSYSIANTNYRYGFNGKEKSLEIEDQGNTYSAQFWEYDSRTGRRWNIDPITIPNQSPYLTFYDNPIRYNDPFGDDPPKKPNFWTRVWRGINNDYYKNRAEDYANQNKIDEKNIIDLGSGTWVAINDKNPKDVRYSIFRKEKIGDNLISIATSPKNDDINISREQMTDLHVLGNDPIDLPIPGGVNAGSGVIAMGSKGGSTIIGIVDKTAKALQAYKKVIRFGVNTKDVLIKGYHLHFDEIVPNLELALVTMNEGKIGLMQVGKLTVGTAKEVQKAVDLFSEAMANSGFRNELLLRLKATQEYLQESFKFTKDAQQAIDKAHEINYLIKSVNY